MKKIIVDNTSTLPETTIKFSPDADRMIKDRLGMFIHFGVYSHLAGWRKGKKSNSENAEWIMKSDKIPLAEYTQYAYEFDVNPDWAVKLAKQAKRAGMKYAVLTTKHHDGYCLFKSNYSFYNHFSIHGRDLVREYVDAMRQEGIKPGFYYSHAMDWAEPDGAGYRSLYYGGSDVLNCNYWDYPDKETKDFKRYFYGKCIPQIKELLTNYGDVYLLWFDYPHDITKEQAKELYDVVKSIQPHCLVSSRLGYGYGDYNSLADNTISTVPLGVPNECLVTLNDTWGYRSYDQNWKTSEEIIEKLARCTSSETTFLVNVGPDGKGEIPNETVKILDELGKWKSKNLTAIDNSSKTPFLCGFEWGTAALSQDGKSLYLYVLDNDTKDITLNGIDGKVLSVRSTGGKTQSFTYLDGKLDIALDKSDDENLPVLVVEFEDEPKFPDWSIQHGNLLTLTPYYGKKYSVDGDVHVQKELVFQYNLFDPLWGKRGLSLSFNATISSWTEQKEYIEWDAEFVNAGEYICELITAKMEGEALVEIDVNGNCVSKKITFDSADSSFKLNRTGAENFRYVYKCGTVKVQKGKALISIKRIGDGANVPVAELKLRKV